ncbi:MAG: DUF1566 domain-containing protein [Thermoanaerobaculia bacterium]
MLGPQSLTPVPSPAPTLHARPGRGAPPPSRRQGTRWSLRAGGDALSRGFWLAALVALTLYACGDLASKGPEDASPAANPGQPSAPGADGDAAAGQPPPPGPAVAVDDLERLAAGWPAVLNKMQRDLEEIESFHGANQVPPLLKLEAWQRFLQAYHEDVTFSYEDDKLRQTALGHIETLKAATRFVDFDDGTVLDTQRQLMWTGKGQRTELRHATEYCRNLTFGLGRHRDWRMPTFEELRELYDSTSAEAVKILGGIEISSYRGGVWSSKSQGDCRERTSTCPAFLFYDGRREQYEHQGEVLCVRAQQWPMELVEVDEDPPKP